MELSRRKKTPQDPIWITNGHAKSILKREGPPNRRGSLHVLGDTEIDALLKHCAEKDLLAVLEAWESIDKRMHKHPGTYITLREDIFRLFLQAVINTRNQDDALALWAEGFPEPTAEESLPRFYAIAPPRRHQLAQEYISGPDIKYDSQVDRASMVLDKTAGWLPRAA